jgi:hypothetical protein
MSLMLTIAHDPSALAECSAALLTACYVAKLTFFARDSAPLTSAVSSSPVGVSRFPVTQERMHIPSNAKAICRVLSEGKKKPVKPDLRDKFLRLFAVGETIHLPKKSLRRQSTFWRR